MVTMFHFQFEGTESDNCFSNDFRTKRFWKPNIQWSSFHSDLLNRSFQVRVSTTALRCIKKAGGVDNYILFTPEREIDSAIGMELKKYLVPLWEAANGQKYNRRRILYEKKLAEAQKLQNARGDLLASFNATFNTTTTATE